MKNDNVNHPSHYTQGKVEAIDAIEAALGKEGLKNFCLGNSIKYMMRAKYKEHFKEDLMKAQWYIRKAIDLDENDS